MSTKRKRDESEEVKDDNGKAKRQRRHSRSHSEPQPDSDRAVKRTALKRLFGRISSVDNRRLEDSSDEEYRPDENDDPLLDSIPVELDPEQLGFLVCAQETLRFLHTRGMNIENPILARLRLRFLRGIHEMGFA